MKNRFYDIAQTVLGSVIFSVAVAWIASPVGLVTGGVSGIGIVIKELTRGAVPIFITSIVLNIPLFVICTLQRGIGFTLRSFVSFATLTVALWIFEAFPSPINLDGDLTVSALAYAILAGVGLGLVLRAGATSGGTDMLAAIIKKKLPSLSVPIIIAVADTIIVAMGVFVFGVRLGLYAVASLFVMARVMDGVLSGFGTSKSVFIVSDKSTDIAKGISNTLQRGVTGIRAMGMYTGKEKNMLFTVVSSRELSVLRRIVGEYDRKAFVTVGDAKEVLGEGFEDILASENTLS